MPKMTQPILTAPSTVWAFDFGLASLGEAVRSGSHFLHSASHLIPAELGQRGPATSPGTPANLYRAMKTRDAHRAREERLRAICAEAGIEVLAAKRVARSPDSKGWQVVQNSDKRLTREFPPRTGPDMDTCYTSCLLRIKLLQGEKLESWQVFKALHSAIQRRGYDGKPAWISARITKRNEKNEDDMVTSQRTDAYLTVLQQMAPEQAEYQFPCYLDAWRMGLWNPTKPKHVRLRIDHNTEPARNRGEEGAIVAPRELVIAECKALLKAAAQLFPKLSGREDEILFGKGRVPYASYDPKLRQQLGLRQGGASDWDGILGQKVPRFDNRIIAKCALIPRLNVCSAVPREHNDLWVPDSLLPAEVTLLMKLKNLRVDRGSGREEKLRAEEIKGLFLDRKVNQPSGWAFKPSVLEKALKKYANGARPAAGHSEVSAPSLQGRSRFSRPALRILKDFILSGRSPAEQHAHELAKLNGNTDTQRGLIAADLDFLKRMPLTWDDIHVPDQQHEMLLATRAKDGRDAAIRRLLGSINDPIVRHRLETYWRRLRYLETEAKFGQPSHVVLEFVRNDFLGDKAKRDLALFQKRREQERKDARAKAKAVKAESRSAATKLELLKDQGGICLYTGQGLAPTDVESLEIEHIVPRNHPIVRGPDAMVNYVVTTKTTNDAKGNRTPYEWFAAKGMEGWNAYKARVEARTTQLGRKKLLLLTSPDAPSLVERYTALAETAWIAKLAQTLVALHFGWPIRSEKGERRITVVSGGLTARIRRRYRLNSLLNPCPQNEDPLDWEETCEKNRSDDRHHALDAMVISFIPDWARDQKKEKFFGLPKEVTRDTFAEALKEVFATPLAYEKPVLAATAYSLRHDEKAGDVITQRAVLADLAQKPAGAPGKTKFDLNYLGKQAATIRDPKIKQLLTEQIEKSVDESAWVTFCANVRLPRKDGSLGARIKKVSVFVGEPTEYHEMSKDGSGTYRKAKKEHRGQYIFRDKEGKAGACPVYAFQAVAQVRERLWKAGYRPLMFLQSGCLAEVTAQAEHEKSPLPAGKYQINSVRSNTDSNLRVTKSSYVKLTAQDGTTYAAKPKPGQRWLPLYSLESLLSAGLRRIA